jgi:hypothetical protein
MDSTRTTLTVGQRRVLRPVASSARHAEPDRRPIGLANATAPALSNGPSYREEYMHSQAQNVDDWLDSADESASPGRGRH